MTYKTYLGDGLYAEFDGYGIWLRADVPNTNNIYLEPSVLWSLRNFYESAVEKHNKDGDDGRDSPNDQDGGSHVW